MYVAQMRMSTWSDVSGLTERFKLKNRCSGVAASVDLPMSFTGALQQTSFTMSHLSELRWELRSSLARRVPNY